MKNIFLSAIILQLLPIINKAQVNDTIFLLKNESQSIYIDTSKKSESYKTLNRFKLDSNFFDEFSKENKKVNGIKAKLKKFNVSNIPNRWVKIVYYQNTFYAYKPCDFLFDYRFTITDSCFVDYTDLPSPQKILKFRKKSNSDYYFVITQLDNKKKKIHFRVIDKEKEIAVVEEFLNDKFNKVCLMVNLDKIKQLPIIVNSCDEKSYEYVFDNPNFIELIKNSK